MRSAAQILVNDLRPLSHRRWMRLAEVQAARFVTLLHDVHGHEWEASTACDPWTVKDIAAHVLGWAEGLTSPAEYLRQKRRAGMGRGAGGRSALDVTNDVQVELHRATGPQEVVERLERVLPRFHLMRKWSGLPLRVVPYREGFSGHWVTLGYVMDVMLTRDHFMHRSDICSALHKPFATDDAERLIVHDVVREWVRRARADLRLELRGPAGGSFVAGTGEAGAIAADAVEFARVLAGRPTESMELSGDRARIEGWLAVRPTF